MPLAGKTDQWLYLVSCKTCERSVITRVYFRPSCETSALVVPIQWSQYGCFVCKVELELARRCVQHLGSPSPCTMKKSRCIHYTSLSQISTGLLFDEFVQTTPVCSILLQSGLKFRASFSNTHFNPLLDFLKSIEQPCLQYRQRKYSISDI